MQTRRSWRVRYAEYGVAESNGAPEWVRAVGPRDHPGMVPRLKTFKESCADGYLKNGPRQTKADNRKREWWAARRPGRREPWGRRLNGEAVLASEGS